MVNADRDKSILVLIFRKPAEHPAMVGGCPRDIHSAKGRSNPGSLPSFFVSDAFPGKRNWLKKQLFGSHTLD
jgi:hypothetical protein